MSDAETPPVLGDRTISAFVLYWGGWVGNKEPNFIPTSHWCWKVSGCLDMSDPPKMKYL